jgi:PDZ domain-containing secreted protein
MKWERRFPLPWLISGVVILCAWCSFLSGLGGWIMGQDVAQREAQIKLETAIATRPDLPPLGVQVIRLDRSGPAARAGIRRGDVIVAIDDTLVEAARDLHDQLNRYHAGDTVRLTVQSERGEEQVDVRTDPFPGDSTRPYLGIYYTARGEEPADL